jgi:hypothetical protein
MDVKVGINGVPTKMHKKEKQMRKYFKTTSFTHGFRICGFKVRKFL